MLLDLMHHIYLIYVKHGMSVDRAFPQGKKSFSLQAPVVLSHLVLHMPTAIASAIHLVYCN